MQSGSFDLNAGVDCANAGGKMDTKMGIYGCYCGYTKFDPSAKTCQNGMTLRDKTLFERY
ncbi:MAG: hypothetical protein IJX89_04175 [Alphaproteobacteria bacterium]|nr:hypothetical protein [Alphaproteobacteria bacterium]